MFTQNITFVTLNMQEDPLQQRIYRCCHGHTKYLIVGLNLELTLLIGFVAALVIN